MMVSQTGSKIQLGPERRQFVRGPGDQIRESIGKFFDLTPIASESNSGAYQVKTWFSDNCVYTLPSMDTMAVRRTKSQAEGGAHLVLVQRFLTGHLLGRIGDLSVDRFPGEVYLLDMAHQFESVQFPSVIQNVFIPKKLLGYDPDQHAPFLHLSRHPTVGKLLTQQFDLIYGGLESEHALNATAQSRFIACLRTALGTDRQDGDVRRQAREAMTDLICRYIERNLESPDLSVTAILAEFGVSRATLYRMFEDKGGVRQYVSDRRLFRAVAEITRRPTVRGELTRIAEKWGFSSDANFNRSVRRHFGVPPGALNYGSVLKHETATLHDTFGAGFAHIEPTA
ncbi:MAG: helix-turn-helix domain-containing protein [Hyphomonadaceae bacterium]|nr:helix-turn-helix domain-containing protein [Hyphomonadaceae bacterium]